MHALDAVDDLRDVQIDDDARERKRVVAFAAEHALATMLDLMERELGLERSHALALSSVVVDLHVTQIVNGAKGVHAVLHDDAIR